MAVAFETSERARPGRARPRVRALRSLGRAGALALAGGALLLLGGCGASARPRLAPGTFHRGVERTCTRAQARLQKISRPASPGDVPAFLRRAASAQGRAIKQLEALRPPAALDARWSAQTDLLDRQLAIVQNLADGVKDGHGDAVGAVTRRRAALAALRARAARGWRALGLPGCA